MTRLQKSIALLALLVLVITVLWFSERPARDFSRAPVTTNGLTIESWHTKNGARVLFVLSLIHI